MFKIEHIYAIQEGLAGEQSAVVSVAKQFKKRSAR
jgi:hypothetical protein